MCIKHNHTWSELRNFLLYRRRGYMYMYSLTSPYGHLYNTDTSLLWTVHLVPEMPKIIHPYPYNTDTSAKRTLGSVPLVSILKRFDCTCMSLDWIPKSFVSHIEELACLCMYFTTVSAIVLVTVLVSTFLYVACHHLSVLCRCLKANMLPVGILP